MSTNHYDLLGRLVLVQNPFGWSTNRYDNLGQLVQSVPSVSVRYALAEKGSVLTIDTNLGCRSWCR